MSIPDLVHLSPSSLDFPSSRFVLAVPLRPVFSNHDVGAALTRVEVADAGLNGSIDDGWLRVHAVVAEEDQNAVESTIGFQGKHSRRLQQFQILGPGDPAGTPSSRRRLVGRCC